MNLISGHSVSAVQCCFNFANYPGAASEDLQSVVKLYSDHNLSVAPLQAPFDDDDDNSVALLQTLLRVSFASMQRSSPRTFGRYWWRCTCVFAVYDDRATPPRTFRPSWSCRTFEDRCSLASVANSVIGDIRFSPKLSLGRGWASYRFPPEVRSVDVSM
ncbi:hypothetical protein RJT34_15764 [Clitoria ternatea]|uniref:Uncharacterized protein n=1 Tax=Clitoria ternatea TaxID=43366 RepID=A0AAN9PBR5_CLITE